MAAMTARQRHLEHLPPGAQPGPQSRRRRSDVRIRGWIAPALALAGVLSLVSFAASAAGFDTPIPDLGIGIGGTDLFWLAVAGVLIGIAFTDWRKANPRRDPRVTIELDRDRVRRGQEVRALVAGMPERTAVEVSLTCRVHWDQRKRSSASGDRGGSTTRVVAEATASEDFAQASPSGEAHPRLPADQPYSHEGSVISFAWLITARTMVDGKRGRPSMPVAVWVDP